MSLALLRNKKENILDHLYYLYPESNFGNGSIKLFFNNEKLKEVDNDKEFKGNYIEFEILNDNYCFGLEDSIKNENFARRRANLSPTHLVDLNGEVLNIEIKDKDRNIASINPIQLKIKGSLLLKGNCIYFTIKTPCIENKASLILSRRIDVKRKGSYFKTEDDVCIKVTYVEGERNVD